MPPSSVRWSIAIGRASPYQPQSTTATRLACWHLVTIGSTAGVRFAASGRCVSDRHARVAAVDEFFSPPLTAAVRRSREGWSG